MHTPTGTRFWTALRLVLVVGGLFLGPRLAGQYRPAGWLLSGCVFLAMLVIGVLFGSVPAWLALVGTPTPTTFSPPSWSARPVFGEPHHFLHAVGWYFIAVGISALGVALANPATSLLGGSAVAGLGAGLLGACHLVAALQKRRIR